ncbi:hypothetical protein I541_5768 [Mycobacteroides abscessus]|nr:hypothetical protein I541_5768 [Mycobacteroides abscessus]
MAVAAVHSQRAPQLRDRGCLLLGGQIGSLVTDLDLCSMCARSSASRGACG